MNNSSANHLHGASLCEIQAAIASGKSTATEVTRHLLERIKSLQPQLNCFIRIDAEEALQTAARLDRQRREGRPCGPLHGVPLAHKDMYYSAGKVTTCGSRIRRQFVAPVTSTLLQRLEAAGAINLGTLNMTEFAFGPTGHNAVWGRCGNPWHSEHISGGSSSGSGAAVAARLAFGSLGSDSGGSVRLPAAMCGVVGLKPTLTRLSLFGAMGLSASIDTAGVLARTAADCARLMDVIAGPDTSDPLCSRLPAANYSAAVGGDIAGLRIGTPGNYFYDHASDEIRRLMDDSLEVLASLGAEIVDVQIPAAEHLSELSRAVLYPEGSARHAHWLRHCPGQYSPQIKVRAATGFAIPAPVYLEALHIRPRVLKTFVDSVFSQCDVLHTPLMGFAVPTAAETDVDSRSTMWRTIGRLVHCTAPFNYLGLPAISVPAGFTSNTLPAALQLVARPFDEAALLRVAAAYQSRVSWHETLPRCGMPPSA